MENKSHAMAAGTFVLVVAAILIVMAVWLTRDSGKSHTYELSSSDTVTGLQPQAAVRYKGVAVGKVTYIGFDPDVPGNVVIRIAVNDNTPLSPSTFATLSYQGITGLAFIQLDDAGGPPEILPAGSSAVPRLPLHNSKLGQLTDQAPEILAKVQQLLDRSNKLLSDDNLQKLSTAMTGTNDAIQQVGQAAKSIGTLTTQLDSTLRERVNPALASVPGLAKNADKTMDKLQKAADDVSRVADDFDVTVQRLNAKNGPMDRLAEGAASLAHVAETVGAATLPRVNRVTEDASRAARQLSRTVNNINDNPQSLIFGGGPVQPGPGEQGFVAPGAAK